ncbi:MAG: enoyl-CoA hydratase-related protein [Thermaurantiacus sp.]
MARIQGDVYAGGMGLVAACDIAVAVETAGFCLSEVKLGLIPATIGPYVLSRMGGAMARRRAVSAVREPSVAPPQGPGSGLCSSQRIRA